MGESLQRGGARVFAAVAGARVVAAVARARLQPVLEAISAGIDSFALT